MKRDVKRSNAVRLINTAMSTNKMLDFEHHKIQTSLMTKVTIRKVVVCGAIYDTDTRVIMLYDYSVTYGIYADVLQGSLRVPQGLRY